MAFKDRWIKANDTEKKPDLIEYLTSLPDTDSAIEQETTLNEEPKEQSAEEKVLEAIRNATMQEMLISASALVAMDENAEEILNKISENPSCNDIRCICGNKDRYYYSSSYMTDNYAMIAMLVLEKDWLRTVAEMVRFNCRTYPSSTPYEYFTRNPYRLTLPQLERTILQMSRMKEYEDIVSVEAFNGAKYLYSRLIFTDKYGKALADRGEEDE